MKTDTIKTLKEITMQYGIRVEQLPDFVARQSPMAYCAENSIIGITGINPANEDDIFGFLHEVGHHIDSLVHPICYAVDKDYDYEKSPPPIPIMFTVLKTEIRAWSYAWQLFVKHFSKDVNDAVKTRFFDHALWCLKTHYSHLCVVRFSELLANITDNKESKKDTSITAFLGLITDRGKVQFESKLPSLLSATLEKENFKNLQENWGREFFRNGTMQQKHRVQMVAKSLLATVLFGNSPKDETTNKEGVNHAK